MRPAPVFVFLVGLLISLGASGPALAAVTAKADAPPERLGHCAIALSRWNAITKAQGGTPQPEYVQRLEAIMALSRTQTGAWSKAFTASLHAQIARYDAMNGEAEVAAMQKDLFACETFINADTRPPEPTYAGPFMAGPGYKVTLATPPSSAGYCYLAFDSLISLQAGRGGSNAQVIGARNGFKAITDGMGEGYRKVAVDSFNDRGSFYRTFRGGHSGAQFAALLLADADECARWLVSR